MTVVISFCAGYRFRYFTKRIETIQEMLNEKIDKKPIEEPKSVLIDLTDPIKEAQYQHELEMKRLNPHE